VEGTRFLDPAELLALARPEDLLTGEIGAPELELLGERIAGHPLIERVAVRRSLPAAVVIEVTERVPVAFLAGRPLRGVDAAGRVLPTIEPPRYGALPFITSLPEETAARTEALLRCAAVLEALEEHAPRLLDTVSEIRAGAGGEIALILSTDAVTVRLAENALSGVLPLVSALVEEGRRRHAPLVEVDLRYAGTVIYRDRKGGG
jgi:cell division septal protein FtsQ